MQKTELRFLEETGSPSGRYALAWGVPGVGAIRDIPDEVKVRNYLVEKKTRKILGTLPRHSRWSAWPFEGGRIEYKSGGNDWHGVDNRGRNHSSVWTLWNRTEETLVVVHQGKWWYNAVYFGEKTRDGFHFTEIGDSIEDFVRTELRRRKRSLYDRDHKADGRDPYVNIVAHKLPVFRPGLLTLGVEADSAWRFKQEDTRLRLTGLVELRVRATASGLDLRPTRFREQRL